MSWTCRACADVLRDTRQDAVESGIAALQNDGNELVLWSFSPPGYGDLDALPAFDLPDVAAARRALLASLRRAVGPYAWAVQGPEVLGRRIERLGVHVVLTLQRPVPDEVLTERAQAAGFGDGDAVPLDALPNTAHSVAFYMSRHLARDGYRLAQTHRRVDMARTGGGWPR